MCLTYVTNTALYVHTKGDRMTSEQITQYLVLNKKWLNLAHMARTANVPESTLRMVVNGHRPLPSQYQDILTICINELKKGIGQC